MNAAALASCPDENALSELVQGLLDDERAAELEHHLDDCVQCRRIVSSVGQSSYVAQRVRTSLDADDGEPSTISMAQSPSVVSQAETEQHIPEAGTVLAGKYRVERLLGHGGMGVVMAATHLTLGKLVAVKLMRHDLAVDAGATQRFVREARAASLLRSEHIVRVIDLDTLDDGSPYIAMEYLEGEDLGALLVRRGPLPAQDAATYIVQVCEAITEAHAAGIVHRDLKPANLFLTMRGHSPCVKVLDFGVSKIIAGGPLSDHVASTDTKALVGSPHYMAPEQLISAKLVDPRTDIWALGCILYELVTGETPFGKGHALAQVLASILRDELPALATRCPDLPAGFADIVTRCLDKDPARRYQRADELAAALAPYVTGGVAPAAPRPSAPMPRIATAIGHTPARLERTPPVPVGARVPSTLSTRGRRWPIAALACAIVFVAGASVHIALDPRPAAQTRELAPATTEQPSVEMRAVPAPAAAPAPVPAAAPAPVASPTVTPAAPPPARAKPKKPAAKSRLEDDLIGPPK